MIVKRIPITTAAPILPLDHHHPSVTRHISASGIALTKRHPAVPGTQHMAYAQPGAS
jgi:hypothetical protein